MKIIIIIDSLRSGGKERRVVELLKGLSKEPNIETELVLLSDIIHYEDVHDLNVKIHILERKVQKDFSIFYRFYKVCKNFKPDLIHSWESMTSIFASPVAKLLGIKFVNSMIVDAPHKLKPFSKNWIRSKLTFPLSSMIIANSAAGLASYNAPKSKSTFIHNGFDLNRIKDLEDPQVIRDRLGIKTRFVVGMVGAFEKRKDYENYLTAAQAIIDKRSDVTFLAVGDGRSYLEIFNSVPKKYLQKIIFTGSQKNVESIVNTFTIGVLTTNHLVHGEGISNSIMEYMAIGKPVIATESGGTSEIVDDPNTGYVISSGRPELLCEKIEYLLDHPEVAEAMGVKGRKRIEDHFTLERMSQSYIDTFKNLIK